MPTPDEWADANDLAEEVNGKPFPMSPEVGIPMIADRITWIRRRVTEAIASDASDETLLDLERQLKEAKTRLQEYQLQLASRN